MRALLLCALLAACGDGKGIRGQDCEVDDDCEKGLSCQDRGAKDVCWPDGTKGCASDDACSTGDICFPFGTGSYCQAGELIDAGGEPSD